MIVKESPWGMVKGSLQNIFIIKHRVFTETVRNQTVAGCEIVGETAESRETTVEETN